MTDTYTQTIDELLSYEQYDYVYEMLTHQPPSQSQVREIYSLVMKWLNKNQSWETGRKVFDKVKQLSSQSSQMTLPAPVQNQVQKPLTLPIPNEAKTEEISFKEVQKNKTSDKDILLILFGASALLYGLYLLLPLYTFFILVGGTLTLFYLIRR